MENRKTIENIYNEMKDVERNNLNNVEHFASIELLLHSNNNGTVKDADVSKEFAALKEKIEEASRATSKFISMLDNRN